MKMGTIAATIAGSISNGGGLVVVNADGSVGVTPASGTGLTLGVAPPATNRYALMQVGNGPIDGTSAGHYTGSASGGGYGANMPSGYTGDLLNLQIAGSSKLSCDKDGRVTVASAVQASVYQSVGVTNPYLDLQTSGHLYVTSRSATMVALEVLAAAATTADIFRALDSAKNPQFAVANVGSGAAPIWALRVRAVANAESMAQLHTLGSYTGRAVQYIDDAGTTLGWAPLYN